MVCALSIILSACGDPLYGGEVLDELLGITGPPVEPAWEVKWFVGGEDGLYMDCELVEANDLFTEDVFYGEMWAAPPVVDEVPDEFADEPYLLALVSLVDGATYEPYQGSPDQELEDEEAFDEDLWLEDAVIADIDRGVWGYAVGTGLLFVSEEGADDAEYIVADAGNLGPGAHWVGTIDELVTITGTFDDALYRIPEEDEVEDLGLYIRFAEFTEESPAWLHTGLALGGAVPLPSCR